ncbi:hypothetical protein BC828DRAFT_373981 [Blastocladiella britannica]|nr:hypothetical protein BC828DRAFT_373981 [Blastocladiella britannica]
MDHSLSAQGKLPWDSNRYNKDIARTWMPITMILNAIVAVFNAALVLTVLRNRKLRVELAIYSWNGLFLTICSGNACYMTFCTIARALVWYQDQWSQSLCTQFSLLGSFFTSYSVLLTTAMALERIFMVTLVRRMSARTMLLCIGASIAVAGGGTAGNSSAQVVLTESGMLCAPLMSAWAGTGGVMLLLFSVAFLIGANAICYWKLRKMLIQKSVADTTSTMAKGSLTPNVKELNDPPPLSTLKSRVMTKSWANIGATSRASVFVKELVVQRRFAMRGVLSTLALGLTVIPDSVLTVYWSFYDKQAPMELEVATVVMIALTGLCDPLIVLAFDSKLRAAMLETMQLRRWFFFNSAATASDEEEGTTTTAPPRGGEVGLETEIRGEEE